MDNTMYIGSLYIVEVVETVEVAEIVEVVGAKDR